jgi:hypothetical protein
MRTRCMGVVCCYVALGVTRATSQQCRVRAPINVLCLTEYLVDAMLVMSTVCCPHTESYLAPHLIYSLHTRTCSNLLCDSVCESLTFALSNAPLCVRTHTPLRSVAQLYACARTPHSALSLNFMRAHAHPTPLCRSTLCVRTHTPLRSVAQLYACARTPHSALSLNFMRAHAHPTPLCRSTLCVRTRTPLRSVAQLYACARTPHSALSLNRREAGLSWSTVSLRCSDQRGSPGGVLYAQR